MLRTPLSGRPIGAAMRVGRDDYELVPFEEYNPSAWRRQADGGPRQFTQQRFPSLIAQEKAAEEGARCETSLSEI